MSKMAPEHATAAQILAAPLVESFDIPSVVNMATPDQHLGPEIWHAFRRAMKLDCADGCSRSPIMGANWASDNYTSPSPPMRVAA
jgi:hypothetical protein